MATLLAVAYSTRHKDALRRAASACCGKGRPSTHSPLGVPRELPGDGSNHSHHPGNTPVKHLMSRCAPVPDFNLRPARKLDATPHRTAGRSPVVGFNPHPVRKPGATRVGESACLWKIGFNPHPARKPGATWHRSRSLSDTEPVSILTQPGSRVQRVERGQPAHAHQVSILTQPGSRVQPRGPGSSDRHGGVSILTQPGSRVQRHVQRLADRPRGSFNPHPARKPGATSHNPVVRHDLLPGFNPHPARKPGATWPTASWTGCASGVSILTQPGSRVQPFHRGLPFMWQ